MKSSIWSQLSSSSKAAVLCVAVALTLLIICPVFAQNGHGVLLSWTQATGTITGNNVYRGTVTSGPYTQIYQSCPSPCTIPNPITSWEDQTGTVGTTYYYVVTAVSSGQESAYSAQTSIVYPPQPPTSLTGTKQ